VSRVAAFRVRWVASLRVSRVTSLRVSWVSSRSALGVCWVTAFRVAGRTSLRVCWVSGRGAFGVRGIASLGVSGITAFRVSWVSSRSALGVRWVTAFRVAGRTSLRVSRVTSLRVSWVSSRSALGVRWVTAFRVAGRTSLRVSWVSGRGAFGVSGVASLRVSGITAFRMSWVASFRVSRVTSLRVSWVSTWSALGVGGITALRVRWISRKRRVSSGTVVVVTSSRQAKAREVQLQEDDDLKGNGKELVVVDLNNGKGVNADCETNALGDVQATVVALSNDYSGVLEKINVDTKLEVKAGSEDLDCGTSLHANTQSCLNGCLAGNNRDGQLVHDAASTIKMLASGHEMCQWSLQVLIHDIASKRINREVCALGKGEFKSSLNIDGRIHSEDQVNG
jgi:hypothetical protein